MIIGALARRFLPAAVVVLVSAGCAERQPASAPPRAGQQSVAECAASAPAPSPGSAFSVFFSCEDDPPRTVRAVGRNSESQARLTEILAALRALAAGPTAEEVEAGYFSHFSSETSEAVLGAELTEQGLVTVNLANISAIIPNASTSSGASILLDQLNSTAFQFQEVSEVTYHFDGSCAAFWNWLQGNCQSITRQMWETQVVIET